MTIRAFRPEDLGAVRSLLASLAEHLGERFAVDPYESESSVAHMIEQPDEYALFVCDDPTVVGFVSVVCYRTLFHRRGTALINELVVAESHRGRGIGAALVARAHEAARARGVDEIEVGVKPGNIDAVRFYRRCGFDQEYLLLGRRVDRPKR